jgi:hypothetical protein
MVSVENVPGMRRRGIERGGSDEFIYDTFDTL